MIFGKMRHGMTLFIAAAMLMITPPLRADIPDGIEALLQGAMARGDRASFDIILASALETFPDDRVALLSLAESINALWVAPDMINEIRVAEREAAEALSKEKARGLAYIFDPKYWSPQLELGAGASTGDTSETSLSFGFTAAREFDDWAHRLDIVGDVARRAGLTSRERYTLEHNSIYSGLNDWLLVNYGLFEIDRFSGFDFRVTETFGIGYQLLDGEKHKLRLELGPGLRYSALEDVEDENGLLIEGDTRTEILGRLAANYAYQITENLRLEETAGFIVGSVSSRFDNEISFTASLTDRLKARLRFTAIFETDVPEGTSAWDTATRLTLVYDF